MLTGEKRYKCEICGYFCVTHSDLNRHFKSKTHIFRMNIVEPKGSQHQSTDKDSNNNNTSPSASQH